MARTMYFSPTIDYLNSFPDEKSAIEAISTQNIRVARIAPVNAYILNYEQIESNPQGFKKRHPVVRECRNLVVRYNNENNRWSIIGKSFSRFFNWGESPDDAMVMQKHFDEGNVTAFEKLDGSLILISYIDGDWRIFTRGSFADTNPFRGTLTDLPVSSNPSNNDTFGSRVRQYVDLTRLNPQFYYVFELCTPGAHITQYDKEFLALLAVVNTSTLDEVPYPLPAEFTMISTDPAAPIRQPVSFPVRSMDELKTTLDKQSPDFEGYVILARLPDSGVPFRIKVKSETYVSLHHLGTKTFTLEDLCKVVVVGEEAEVSGVISMHKPILDKLKTTYDDAMNAIAAFYLDNGMLPRKTYALYVCEREPLPDHPDQPERKSSIPTPIPAGDHPAVTKYASITKATLKPFQWLYFDLHAKKITFTINSDGSTDLRTILASSDRLEKTASSLAALHCKLQA